MVEKVQGLKGLGPMELEQQRHESALKRKEEKRARRAALEAARKK